MEGKVKRRWTPAFAGVTVLLRPRPNNVIPAKAGIQDSQGDLPPLAGLPLKCRLTLVEKSEMLCNLFSDPINTISNPPPGLEYTRT